MANETPQNSAETPQTTSGEQTTPATGVALASVPRMRQASRRRALLKVAGVTAAAAVVAGAAEIVQHSAQVLGSGTGAGPVTFLGNPIRLLDTRASSPYTAGSNHTLQVTGVVVGGVSVPSGSIGVFGNLTVVGPTSGGDLRLYPGPTLPATSSINFAAGQTIANGVTVALNSNGQLLIQVDMASGAHTNVLFDVSAYVY